MIKKFSFFYKSANIYINYKLKRYYPFLVIILPTSKCNLKCTYCTHKRSNKSLKKRSMYKIIDDLHKLKTPVISFSGGEPLMHPSIIDVARYAKRKGFIINLNTNGTLITKENAPKICKYFDTIRISLDGLEEIHDQITQTKGSYNRVVQGLEYLTQIKNRHTKIGLNFVLNQKNKTCIKKFTKLFKNKVDFITFLPNFSFEQNPNIKSLKIPHKVLSTCNSLRNDCKSGNTSGFLNKLSFENSKKYCDAGRLYFSIFSGGGVIICPFYKQWIGNINKESLINIYNRMKLLSPPPCKGCYATCTTEISRIFRLNPIQIVKNFNHLRKIYKI